MSRAIDARFSGLVRRSWRSHYRPRTTRLIQLSNPFLQNTRAESTTATSAPLPPQFEGYTSDLLDRPLNSIPNLTRSPTTPPPPENLPQTERDLVLEKARVVFGSRLAGPGERAAAIEAASTNIAGILVPPRPEEPDNCCMSGCVNCVWDLFRDEMEEWAAKSAEARLKLMAQRRKQAEESKGNVGVSQAGMPGHVAQSKDDDGGGSASNWGAEGGMESFGANDPEQDLFEGIPVGIREFMKTEKKLKARHLKEKSERG